jgi:hypothetical protein
MKKIVFIILLVCIGTISNAQDQGIFGIIPCGIGMGVFDNNYFLDLDIRLLPMSVISNKTGFGITWIPVNYRYAINKNYWSVFNFGILWDFLILVKNKNNNTGFIYDIIIGPFVNINYAPNFNFKNYFLFYGLRFNWFDPNHGAGFSLSNMEIGYRLMENKNNFYFNINISIIALYYLIS